MRKRKFESALMARVMNSRYIMASLSDSNFRAAGRVDDETGEVELLLHGFVGDYWDEMDSLSVVNFLEANKDKPVHVRMNSPGGLVFDGIAIYQALAEHPQAVRGTIEALAASAMTVIAMGVDLGALEMAGNSLFMVHRAWGLAMGNRSVMEDLADVLSLVDEQLIATYAARTGLTGEKVSALMDGKVDGTFLNAEKALELGFVDKVKPLKGEDEPEEDEATEEDAEDGQLASKPDWDRRYRDNLLKVTAMRRQTVANNLAELTRNRESQTM